MASIYSLNEVNTTHLKISFVNLFLIFLIAFYTNDFQLLELIFAEKGVILGYLEWQLVVFLLLDTIIDALPSVFNLILLIKSFFIKIYWELWSFQKLIFAFFEVTYPFSINCIL